MKPDFELSDIKSKEKAEEYAKEQTEMFSAKRTMIIKEGDTWTLQVWY